MELSNTAFSPVSDPAVPRWSVAEDQWLHVGSEVALLSSVTDHARDAYGRIVSCDPDGLPIILVLTGERAGQVHPVPLEDIVGPRVRRPADADPIYLEISQSDAEARTVLEGLLADVDGGI